MSATHWSIFESPIGPLTLIASETGRGLTALRFPGKGQRLSEDRRDDSVLADAVAQLDGYFRGERTEFDLDLDPRGTGFQQEVWRRLLQIPLGETLTYGDLAVDIGLRRDRARAVGAAVGRTPIPIVIPCHRMVGADGSLTGYGGGLQRKAALLDHERRVAGGEDPDGWDPQLPLL